MKPLFLSLLAIVLLSSCAKKENYHTVLSEFPEPGILEAYIDGEHIKWTASCTVHKRSFGTYMSIMAQEGTTRGILLEFKHVQLSPSEYLLPITGEYTPDTSNGYYILYDDRQIPVEQYSSTGGRLIITSISDSIVRGNFYFTTKSPKAKNIHGAFSTKLRVYEHD